MIKTTMMIDDKQAIETLSHNPILPVWLVFVVSYLGTTIGAISAIGIFRRKHWARLLFAFWVPVGLALDLTAPSSSLKPLAGIVALYAVQVFFLFWPKSNNYFKMSTQ
jgi:hypothetical protein